jgi:hypothetical protein
VVDLDATLGEQLLDVAVRQGEAKVPAYRQHDHLGRMAGASEGRELHRSRAWAPRSQATVACSGLTRSSCNSASEPELRRVVIRMARSAGRAFFTNFSTYEGSFPTRTRLALANSWKKLRTRSGCCGNNGQPGC